MKKAAIMLLFWSTTNIVFSQVLTSEIIVDLEHSDLTEITNDLKVTGNIEATTITAGTLQMSGDINTSGQVHASGNLNTSGEVISNGDVHTNSRVYFGGGDNSSFIQHLEGYVGPGGIGTYYLNVAANGFINMKVDIGGRVSSTNVSAERNAYGYMWGTGYITERHIYATGSIELRIYWDTAWRLRIEVKNTNGSHGMMFAGTVTASQTGYGW